MSGKSYRPFIIEMSNCSTRCENFYIVYPGEKNGVTAQASGESSRIWGVCSCFAPANTSNSGLLHLRLSRYDYLQLEEEKILNRIGATYAKGFKLSLQIPEALRRDWSNLNTRFQQSQIWDGIVASRSLGSSQRPFVRFAVKNSSFLALKEHILWN